MSGAMKGGDSLASTPTNKTPTGARIYNEYITGDFKGELVIDGRPEEFRYLS